jgi:hypothetical protein
MRVFVHSANRVWKSRIGHPALTLNDPPASLAISLTLPHAAHRNFGKNILASRCCAGWLRPAFDRHLRNRTRCARSSRDRRRRARFHDSASSFGRSGGVGRGARSARIGGAPCNQIPYLGIVSRVYSIPYGSQEIYYSLGGTKPSAHRVFGINGWVALERT